MSMGTKLPSGMFNTGYTQPYGSGSAANMYGGGYGGGTYDPMLGFGQSSGTGTTYDYPTRYSADYTRYAQSGQPFNQPVMGYNTYGQIFAQPQRPPPTMGGKGGSKFQPQPPAGGGKGRVGSPGVPNPGRDRFGMPLITDLPQQPPTMGGKGGPQPKNDGVTISYPGGSRTEPRFPQRRSNQSGLNQPPKDTGVPGSFLDFYSRQNNPANSIFEPRTGGPGATPPPLTGGVPTDSIGGFGPGQLMSNSFPRPQRDRNLNPAAGRGPEGDNTDYRPVGSNFVGILPTGGPGATPPRANLGGTSPGSFFDQMQQRQRLQEFESGLSGRYRGSVPIEPAPVQANRQVIDENTYNSPFGQLIGVGLGGMPKQTINPYQGSYQIPEIPYQGADLTPVRQQQQLFAQQQQRSDRAPPGMMRNPNYDAASTMLDNVPGPGSADWLRRQEFIPANNMSGAASSGNAMFDNRAFQDFNFGQGFGRMAFQEGGQVPPDANMEMMVAETEQPEMAGEYDRLIQMTMQAILGQVESPDEVIQMFIDEFGVDAFRQLREAVLKQQVPNAQTEGMVDGNGGGMDDQVMGMIGNQRPVAVSPGEYIVPADVVSGLGDGSSKSGADILDELNQAVRMARTGTTQQPRPLMETMQ